MRRVVVTVAAAALVLAFSVAIAWTNELPLSRGSDLGPQVMMRLFGETSDTSAAFSAQQGDRTSESPFRGLALQMAPAGHGASFASGIADPYGQARLSLRDLYDARSARFTPGSSGRDIVDLVPSSTFFAAQYQPVAPVPSISPDPGTVAFAPPAPAGSDLSAAQTHSSLQVPSAPQIGPVRFEGHDDGGVQTPQLDLTHDATYGAGASFDVRAGKRNLNVNLSSAYDQVTAGGGGSFSASTLSPSAWQVPGGVPLVIPSDAGLNRLSLGAGVAVPVMRGLTLNLNYAAQRMYNGYGLPGLQNLDTLNNSYGGRLTFDIPATSGSLSISAYQDRFQDSLLPINGSTQTREDVNFTVKF